MRITLLLFLLSEFKSETMYQIQVDKHQSLTLLTSMAIFDQHPAINQCNLRIIQNVQDQANNNNKKFFLQ